MTELSEPQHLDRCPWKVLSDSGCQWHILANLGAPDLQAPSRSGYQQTAGPPRPLMMACLMFKVGRARRHRRAHGAHGRSAARGSRHMDEGEAPCAPRASNAGLRRMAQSSVHSRSRGPWIHSVCSTQILHAHPVDPPGCYKTKESYLGVRKVPLRSTSQV